MFLALLFGLGSIALFACAPLGSLARSFHWSEPAVLAWDTSLSFVFFLQHSGMLRRGCRERMSKWIAPAWHGALYSIASGAALSLVVLLWQNTATTLLTLQGPMRWLCWAFALFAVAVFAWGIHALRTFDLFGVRALRVSLRGQSPSPEPLVIAGPYRWVRHPLYFGVLVLIWANPDLTLDSLLFRVLWTAWMVVGTWLEERDLVSAFGSPYREYQRHVPMLIPWRGAWAVSK
jgi:protein-S-isoprenylcysteine O-methyltransferase Ste14